MSKKLQQILAICFGTVFIIILIVLAVVIPEPTPFQYTVFRVILALAAAGAATMIPGFLQIRISKWLRASGALGVFIIVYFYNPASIIVLSQNTKTDKTGSFNRKEDSIDYNTLLKLQNTMRNLDKAEYIGTGFNYWPDGGLQNTYYNLASLLSYNDIQNLFGGKIYNNGPHTTSTLDLNSAYDFGHYNHDFLKWIALHVNTALNDNSFIDATKPLYEKYLSKIANNYALVFLYLENHQDLKNALLKDYSQHIENKTLPSGYTDQVKLVQLWNEAPMDEDQIITALKNKGAEIKGRPAAIPLIIGMQNAARDPNHILSRDPIVRSELLTLMESGDSNILGPAIYFWLRRSIDGSETEIFEILCAVMSKYDSGRIDFWRTWTAY